MAASDTAGGFVQRAFTVSTAIQLSISSPASPLPPALAGTAYTQTFAASGGSAPFTWSAATPPPGLSISSSGVLGGTPTTPGVYTFAVTVTDGFASLPQSVTANYSLTVDSVMTITTLSPLPLGVVGALYSQTFTNTGGTAAYSWSVAGGALPAGLTLSSGGILTGVPVAAGTSTFTIQVTDGLNFSQTKAFVLTVASPLSIIPPVLPVVQTGLYYQASLSATGGVPPLAGRGPRAPCPPESR